MVWEFRDTVPVVKALSSDYLQNEHWMEIKSLVKADFNVGEPAFTLEKLLALNVANY
jgi:dynein heavy chain